MNQNVNVFGLFTNTANNFRFTLTTIDGNSEFC